MLNNIYSTVYHESVIDNYNFHFKFISQIEVEVVGVYVTFGKNSNEESISLGVLSVQMNDCKEV